MARKNVENDSLSVWAGEYLEREPLTIFERIRGVAIRAVACVRANDEDIVSEETGFYWSIVVMTGPWRRQAPARLFGHAALLLRRAGGSVSGYAGGDLLARGSVEVGGRTWRVAEYEVVTPRSALWFTLRCGASLHFVRRGRCNDLVFGHFAEIRNPFADKEHYEGWLAASRERLAAEPVPKPGPLMSVVVPVYQTPPVYLEAMLSSVLCQTYRNWELVLVNASPQDQGVRGVLAELSDPRVKVVEVKENLGIAGNTNLGIAAATGDYVSFLDHDDVVEPHALACMVRAIEDGGRDGSGDPLVDLLYCDEDTLDSRGAHTFPIFKPSFNRDLLLSNDYVLHWLTVSRRALGLTQRSGAEVNGAQDYDLTLKVVRLGDSLGGDLGGNTVHVPEVLYHWRADEVSSNQNPESKMYAQEAGARAVGDYLKACGIGATVRRAKRFFTYDVAYDLPKPAPSILCLGMGGVSGAVRESLASYTEDHGAEVRIEELPAGAATDVAALSAAVSDSPVDLVAVLPADVEFGAEAVERLAGYFVRPEVFCVAPGLTRSDGLLSHGGCAVLPDGSVGRMSRLLPAADFGYVDRPMRPYDAAVVEPTCCVFRAGQLRSLGGLDASFATAAYALADAMLRAYAAGSLNVYAPTVEAHLTRPRSMLVEDDIPARSDAALLLERNAALLAGGDPSGCPHLDPWSRYYKLGE